jgi:hypothetical protein
LEGEAREILSVRRIQHTVAKLIMERQGENKK